MNKEIRLTVSHNDPVATPMVRDLNMLEQYGSGNCAILHLYTWEQPAITVGRLQDPQRVLAETVWEENIPVLKRPTGGRQVYHGGDICFTLVIPQAWRTDLSVKSHGAWCGSLFAETLQEMGYQVESVDRGSSPQRERNLQGSACFASTVPREVIANGKKLIGMAHALMPQGVLTQGVLPIDDSYRTIETYSRIKSDSTSLLAHSTFLNELSSHCNMSCDRLKNELSNVLLRKGLHVR